MVEAVCLEDGRCEFLAVAPLPGAESELAAAAPPDAMLKRVSAPLGAGASPAAAAGLTRSNVGAPAAGAALHSSMPADLATTGAFWAPFATSPAAPGRADAATLPPSRAGGHDLEQLGLPYAIP